jgi:hypothetical protein
VAGNYVGGNAFILGDEIPSVNLSGDFFHVSHLSGGFPPSSPDENPAEELVRPGRPRHNKFLLRKQR